MPERKNPEAPPAASSEAEAPERPELVGRLAAGIAHDLNNLLTAITGRVDLILLELETRRTLSEELGGIKEDVREAARVIRKLVAYGGQAPTRRRPTGVAALLDGLEASVLGRRGGEVRLLVRIEADAGPVAVDPGQIRQVLDALVENALEAMPEDGVLFVHVFTPDRRPAWSGREGRSGGDPICIELADNGIGMDAHTLSRAFEPYFSTKTDRGGRGLDLAAARQIVRQNGGEIHLESEPGRGTAVRLLLPEAGSGNP